MNYGTDKVILVAEDDEAIADLLKTALEEDTPYHVTLSGNSDKALEDVRHIKPHLFILDYHISPLNGIALYDRLHSIPYLEEVPAIIMSASLEKHRAEIEHRQLATLGKPFELDELIQCVETLLAQAHQQQTALRRRQ